jgi:hypothetical protein
LGVPCEWLELEKVVVPVSDAVPPDTAKPFFLVVSLERVPRVPVYVRLDIV